MTIAAIAVLLSVLATGCSYELRDVTFDVEKLATAQSSRVYDRNGVLITELRGEQRRTDVTDIALVPEVVRNAVVAIEDERFYEHDGADLKAILRAARSNVAAGGISQGGSTITQQYVGNVFLDRSEETLTRKIEEFFMARRFEQFFTKDFILLRYLNWVYFGNGAYGIEAAARQYFGAPACELAATTRRAGQPGLPEGDRAQVGAGRAAGRTDPAPQRVRSLPQSPGRPAPPQPGAGPDAGQRLYHPRGARPGLQRADRADRGHPHPRGALPSRPFRRGRQAVVPRQRCLRADPRVPHPAPVPREVSTSTPPSTLASRPRAEAAVEAILPHNDINPDAAATVLGLGGGRGRPRTGHGRRPRLLR